MSADPQNLIWIDLEMTGLDFASDHIIEIATIVTDSALEVLAEGPVFAIQAPEAVLAGMDEWNTKQHGGSGLTQRVRESGIGVREAERGTLEFVRKHVPKGCSPMCGSSICTDRRFLARWMPELEAYFHYRHIDVSTVKELAHRWYPQGDRLRKDSQHLALQDIRDSIEELRFYREHYFQAPR